MTAVKPPLEADYYAYEFAHLLGMNTISSIQSVDQYGQFGHSGNLINEGQMIVGTQVRVLWAGGDPGTRYMTTVRVLDSGSNILQVQGEICVGETVCGGCFTQNGYKPPCSCNCSPCQCVTASPDAIVIPIIGGQLKRFIVQRAYGVCGQSVAEFELTTEEYSAALRAMNDLMAMWEDEYGINLGYNYPTYGEGSPEDESGIPRGATQAVVYALATEIAPQIGKTLSPEANRIYWNSFSLLKSNYTQPRDMGFGRATIQGAGNRWTSWRGPFFQIEKKRWDCGCPSSGHVNGCKNWGC
jgi:hypothetical protein